MKVFVHRYRWSHEKRRRQLRRALADGFVSLLAKLDDGFLYEVPANFKVRKG